MQDNNKKFGLKDKLGYMFGDLGNDFTFIFASSFLLIFYTKVLGINGNVVGILFLVSRCIDAFTDVTMGRIVDKSKPTKEGKFKPWIKRVAVPVSFAGFLMFQASLASASMTVKIVYMYITYILWGSICYTAINIPYGSMASAITDKPEERASLSTFRNIGATLAGMFIGTITPILVYTLDSDGNQIVKGGNTFTMVAGMFSIFALISYFICYKFTTERVKMQTLKNDEPFFKSLGRLLKNKALIGIIGTSLALVVLSLILGALNNYVFLDYYNNTSGLILINSINPLIGIFIVSPITLILGKKIGKKETISGCLLIGALIFLASYFIRPDNMYTYVTLYIIGYTFAYVIFGVLVWAAITDVIDDQEVKTGTREDGVIYSVYSFARKIGQAIAGGLGGYILTYINYDSLAVVQTKEVVESLYTSVTILPAICCVIAFIFLQFIYPLTKSKIARNNEILAQKRNKVTN